MVLLIVGAAMATAVIWAVSARRRLAVLDENAGNAMNQIGVQLASRLDAVTALVDLTKRYADQEFRTMTAAIRSRCGAITASSTPDEVAKQEGMISETLDRVSMVAERHPELKADGNYARCMNAVDSYEKMVRTSRLIYNDSVTRLNREIRMFPASLLAGILGFRQRAYLETEERGASAPDKMLSV